jgi:hypothetical protein
MNFDRISFRTTPEQRAFLERINHRYRCRTITGLMRKLLDEIMAKEAVLFDGKPVVQDSLDLTIPLASDRKINDDRLVLKDTRLGSYSASTEFTEFTEQKQAIDVL